MPILVIGLSHRSSPVALRERFAFAEARVPAALQLLHDSGSFDESVILSTCNRVEIYASTLLDSRRASRVSSTQSKRVPTIATDP